MKKIALLILFVIITIGDTLAQRLVYNQKAPEIVVKSTLKGDKIPKSKPIYIEFFSTNCSDNKRQLRSLSNLSKSYGDQIYFAIITKDNLEDVEAYFSNYAKEYDLNFSILLDNAGASFTNFNIKFIPNAVLIDSKGRFIWQGKSSNIDENTIQKLLK